MIQSMNDIVHPGAIIEPDPEFPNAPEGWARSAAAEIGVTLGIDMTEDHWEAVRVIQGCYKDEAAPRLRLVRDALDARFSDKGGIKYLSEIFPNGPITQACLIAGVEPPAGSTSSGFGSVA